MIHAQLPDPHLDAQFYEGIVVKRLLAWVLDVLVISALVLAALVASFGLLAFVFPALVVGMTLAYRSLCIVKWSATLGMRALAIELRNHRGERLDPFEAVAHTFIYVFAFMTVVGAMANAALMLVTDRHQGLSDLILGTAAINRPADPI